MKAKSTPPNFMEILNRLMSQFDQAVYLLEKRDYAASTDLAQKVTDDLSSVIKMLGDDYERALRANRFSRLETIKKDLGQVDPAKMEDSLSEYVEMLVELEKYVSYSRREVHRNYPSDSFLQAWLKAAQKHWVPITLTLVCVIGGVSTWQFSQRINYGLVAEYFSTPDLANSYKRQIDPKIDFKWGRNSPFPRWKKDQFSVRWSGYLEIPEDGLYEFQTHSDDGVNLWLGENKIISNWTNHRLVVNKAIVQLKKGYIPIRLEYYEANRTAAIHLMWKREKEQKPVVIKSKYFVPTKERLRQ